MMLHPAAIHRRRLQRRADELMVTYTVFMIVAISLVVGLAI